MDEEEHRFSQTGLSQTEITPSTSCVLSLYESLKAFDERISCLYYPHRQEATTSSSSGTMTEVRWRERPHMPALMPQSFFVCFLWTLYPMAFVWRGVGVEPVSNGGDSAPLNPRGLVVLLIVHGISQSFRMNTMLIPSHVHLRSL